MLWAIHTSSKGQHACPLAEQEVTRFIHVGFTCTFASHSYILGILRRICALYCSAAEPFLYAVARPCSATQIEFRSSFSGTLPSFKDLLFVLHNTGLPHFNLQVAFFLSVAFLVNDFYILALSI
jgi:hypothetical protein